jgi:hypothetical protein
MKPIHVGVFMTVHAVPRTVRVLLGTATTVGREQSRTVHSSYGKNLLKTAVKRPFLAMGWLQNFVLHDQCTALSQ